MPTPSALPTAPLPTKVKLEPLPMCTPRTRLLFLSATKAKVPAAFVATLKGAENFVAVATPSAYPVTPATALSVVTLRAPPPEMFT